MSKTITLASKVVSIHALAKQIKKGNIRASFVVDIACDIKRHALVPAQFKKNEFYNSVSKFAGANIFSDKFL